MLAQRVPRGKNKMLVPPVAPAWGGAGDQRKIRTKNALISCFLFWNCVWPRADPLNTVAYLEIIFVLRFSAQRLITFHRRPWQAGSRQIRFFHSVFWYKSSGAYVYHIVTDAVTRFVSPYQYSRY